MLGEIHPEVLERWQIEMPAAAMELDLHQLLDVQ
jgi:phenylalanyl-tRNA synthetase beta subunit